jgi:pimeloyl-ACP methyl ester carboxylesterase
MDVSLAAAMKKHLRDARILMLPTGHAAALEAPETFNDAVLDFMKRLSR